MNPTDHLVIKIVVLLEIQNPRFCQSELLQQQAISVEENRNKQNGSKSTNHN